MNGEIDPKDYYEILDDLRESGEINMYGAPRWLEDNYGLSKKDARQVFKAWADSFTKRHPPIVEKI